MRRHINYANAVATLALVFAMSGSALAASHYLITSTKQIKPAVLRKLRGNAGSAGAAGATGPVGSQGPQGKEGPQGPAGPFPATLPKGQTLTGVYNLGGTNPSSSGHTFAFGSISFPYRLAATPEVEVIFKGNPPTSGCPGTPSSPQAASGKLCIYEAEGLNWEEFGLFPATPYGENLELGSTTKAQTFSSSGTWAVTG